MVTFRKVISRRTSSGAPGRERFDFASLGLGSRNLRYHERAGKGRPSVKPSGVDSSHCTYVCSGN